MKTLTIKSHFTFNRRNNRQKISCEIPNMLFIPRKTIVFAELSENIKNTEKDLIDNVFKKANQGILTTYDFDLNLVIIHNTTFEDFYIPKDEPIFLLKDKKSKS